MKRLVAIILLLLSLTGLAAGDHFDISLSFGHGIYRWPERGISFSYGANFGLSERWEMEVWGVSELLPHPFESNMFGIDFSAAVLGPRSTASKVSGSGINTLVGFGGFYRTDNNGAGPMLSVTPLTVGSPISGRRERLLKTSVGYDAVNNEVVVLFSLLDIDFFVRGTYRDYFGN